MIKFIVTLLSFLITLGVVMYVFLTATTYIHLAVAIALYPFLVYLAYGVVTHKNKYSSKTQEVALQPLPQGNEGVNESKNNISDIDKRAFLKLIGGAGIFLFLFSLFNKRPDPQIFQNIPLFKDSVLGELTRKSLTPPAGTTPMSDYRISDIDDNNIVAYYGFTNKDNEWIIMKVDTESGAFRYAKGIGNYSDNWAKRDTLMYDYFNAIF